MYGALTLPIPRFLLWFDSPLDWAWAHSLLHQEQDPRWFERYRSQASKLYRESLDQARSRILAAAGLSNWQEARELLIPPPSPRPEWMDREWHGEGPSITYH